MSRCHYSDRPDYANIKCTVTPEELRRIWIRDDASIMRNPSVDRIDPDKDYTADNIRIIPLTENVGARRSRPRKETAI
jgi:hypothetical protein